ncbi:lysozyme [Celeribacter naphthalenivorans]|uniref:lysozyme n=1 Tax=Celeribacter naphthalenivorans TaxID=1614694 RepID=UPI001CFB63C8|nr:glycoside hydrolase family protein [Celeribacter naphthalenivorans]
MFKLIPDAGRVVKFSYTFWLSIFGFVWLVAPEIYFATTGYDVSPFIRWVVTAMTFAAIAVLRFIQQPGGTIRNWIKIIAMALALLLAGVFLGIATAQAGTISDAQKAQIQADTIPIATPLIAKWEGFRSCPYIPVKGDVPTIGFGSTRGITMNTPCITRAKAEAMLAEEVREYMVNFNRLMPQDAWLYMDEFINSAFTDLSYNVGWGAAARSTAAKRLAAGNVDGACYAVTWYNKAGGRVYQGLVNRRQDDLAVCRGDLSGLS